MEEPNQSKQISSMKSTTEEEKQLVIENEFMLDQTNHLLVSSDIMFKEIDIEHIFDCKLKIGAILRIQQCFNVTDENLAKLQYLNVYSQIYVDGVQKQLLQEQIMQQYTQDMQNRFNVSMLKKAQQIGSGRQAFVSKTKDSLTKQLVAVKQIFGRYKISDFHRELRLMQGLTHFNVVQFISHFEMFIDNKKHFCIVMPFYENKSLAEYIDEQGGVEKIPIKIREKWMIQMIQGLNYLHSKCIMHRDLKPENIFIDKELNVVIGDLGVGKNTFLEQANTFAGTAIYMAPELFSNTYDNKADIWSLGLIFYTLLSGNIIDEQLITSQPNYIEDLNQNKVIMMQLHKYIPQLQQSSTFFEKICQQMMQSNPKLRPSSLELHEAMKQYFSCSSVISRINTANLNEQDTDIEIIAEGDHYLLKAYIYEEKQYSLLQLQIKIFNNDINCQCFGQIDFKDDICKISGQIQHKLPINKWLFIYENGMQAYINYDDKKTMIYKFDDYEGIGLYADKQKQGFWTIFTQKGCHKGIYINNKREGIWVKNLNDQSFEKGFYRNDLKHGKWIQMTNLVVETGSYSYGFRHGLWKFEYQNKTEYGIFNKGIKHGKWYLESNQQLNPKERILVEYTGFYESGQQSGYWFFKYSNSDTTEGGFVNGFKSGIWTEQTSDCSIIGPYVQGFKQGKFQINYKNGDHFEGYYYKDKKSGWWRCIYQNGDICRGQYVNDKKDGKWSEIYHNGVKFDGFYRQDVKQGFCTETNEFGDIQEGLYENNIQQGQWSIFTKNGSTQSGMFDKGFRQGEWVESCQDEVCQGMYNKGKREGVWTQIVGSTKQYFNYQNGMKSGKYIKITPLLEETGQYYQDLPIGDFTIKYKNLTLEQFTYENGEKKSNKIIYLEKVFYYSEDLKLYIYTFESTEERGQFSMGLPSGNWSIKTPMLTASGEMCNGKRQGRWQFNFATGEIDVGDYENAVKIGIWTLRYEDRYETGLFSNGIRQGSWQIFYKNGDRTVGPYLNDQKHGSWIFYKANGDVHKCQFVKNEQRQWEITYALGGSATGSYKNNQKHGRWIEISETGQTQEGVYKNGLKEGKWVERSITGEETFGEYKNNLKVGKWQIQGESRGFETYFEPNDSNKIE